MYTLRTLEAFIKKATDQFPVLLLTGPRQVGKTTLLLHLAQGEGTGKRTYVTLDDPRALSLAREDPALFLQRFPPPVLIDEIQYAPQLLPFIKMAVDKDRQPGLFWLTGSQQFHLMKGISESLAGRVGIIRLLGFSYRERMGRTAQYPPFLPVPEIIEARSQTDAPPSLAPLSLKEVYKIIWRGALPAVALHEETDRDLFYSSYVQTYLQRDVRDLARIGDLTAFLRFLRASAARSGQLLNLAGLARDADISPNTAKSWLSILEASGIVYLLAPYHTNVAKRFVKTPKLYFLDTGLCAWLTQWSSPETLEAGAASGAILETWILSELLKGWWHNGQEAPFWFYRDKDQKEIDLIIIRDGVVHPLEIKKTAAPGKDAVRHFRVLKKLGMPIGPGGVICLSDQSLPLTDTASSIPVGMI
uniref:AAA+ ATPase domain-containing protein n=1 Tax=Candidatus Kentrum sp. DK TaxID=2126562 RepID=A0A450SQC4_9GAMM|nr:MAG: hypothetical protein BECKDK2373C_GA0170839_105221 [Candidatus Kentron sp. DK]